MSAKHVVQTVVEVADFFSVSRQTVFEWKNKGMPTLDDGYDLKEVLKWRDAWAAKQNSEIETDIEREEYLKMKAERQTKQAKLAGYVGKVIEKSIVITLLSSFAAVVRSRLQAIPGELAASIPPEFRHDLMIELEQKISLILTEMASWLLPSSLKTKSEPTTSGGNTAETLKKSGAKSAKNSRRGKSRSD